MTIKTDLPAVVEGDDIEYPLRFSKPDGSPIDISGWTVSMTVADRDAESEVTLIEKDIENHDDADAGETSFEFTSEDTAGIVGAKRYDIQITRADGSTKTPVLGSVRFLDGVTDRSVS